MKKILSFVLSVCIILSTVSICFGLTVSAAISLTDEQLQSKNYPLPKNQTISTLYATYDASSQCTGSISTEEGTYYDTASNKITTTQASREHNVMTSRFSLDGIGFMFWYKSSYSYTMRIRNATNSIIVEGTLPASPEGRWVTYYYYGKCINFTFKTDMSKDITSKFSSTDTFMLSVMSSAGEKSIYFDEFYTFKPVTTSADVYENDEQAFKFSAAKFNAQTKTIDTYYDDGSVELSSEYGSSAATAPISITYNVDNDRFAKAIEIAKNGSGYLQFQCENISCKDSSGADAYSTIKLTLNGINQTITRYNIGAGVTETYLWNVSGVETVTGVNLLTLTISSSSKIKDVKFKFSPITVYHFAEGELVYQAEDLNPKISSGSITYHNHDADKYVYIPSSVEHFSFELPQLEVGEYTVYANCKAAKQTTTTKYDVCVNNLRQLFDVEFSDDTYTSSRHIKRIEIGNIKITKDYSYGASTLKFKLVPNYNSLNYIDFFVFVKTNTVVEAEPASNFEIKEYPEMDDYETLTVLNTFNDYVCGTDARWYNNQVAGYVGDGTAYNLNSRGTVNKGTFDNNTLYNNQSKPLDGNGIRFWYKGAAGTLQFKKSGSTITYRVPYTSTAKWYTVFYTELVADGDMSSYYRLDFKTDNSNACYFDELHTIQEKLGDIIYSLNGDGTASVTGYNLRLEDVVIASEYQGCPVVSIAEGAFANSITLDSVVIPSTVKTIGKNAFDGCLNLTTVDFASVETICDTAFNNCEKLTDVTLPSTANNISATAFSGCSSLYINVGNGSYAKDYCTVNRVDYICKNNDGYKYYCDFNDSGDLVKILDYSGTSKNISVAQTIDNVAVKVIESGCFESDDLESVVLPDSVIKIGDKAFKGCSSLKSIKMSGVQTIGTSAFEECVSLETVEVSDAVATIGDRAFYNCVSLKEFYFGDNITTISSNAFYKCTLTAVLSDATYENKTGYSYTYVNANNFAYYPNTESVYKYYVINYIATVCGYTDDSAVVVIPSQIDGYDVEAIGDSAFKNNTNITSLSFLGNVRTINDNAFYGCSSLSQVTFNDNLREISAYAFAYCSSLNSVDINSVVVVSTYAFYGSPTKINYLQTNFIRNALDYVDGMTAGWNLGNTLDAHSHSYSYGDLTVYESEHLWRKSNYITQGLFDLVAEKFNTIRIPITWNVFIDPNNNYKIDKEYMDRIQEVVDMCYRAGFEYIIINTHHDSDYYFNPHPDKDLEVAKTVIGAVWQQIGERFANYDEKLIFESMNEIRSMELDWSSADWYGQDTVLFERYNELNKQFYSTVRASGGNNDKRYLMIQTYGGQKDSRQINNLWLPSVTTDDHIIASVHWYIETVTEANYTPNVQRLKTSFVDKGIPCVIGECGLPAYYDSSGNITVYNDDYREQWGTFFFDIMNRYGLKAIIWEDHGNYSTVNLSGGVYSWKFPKYVEAIYQVTKKESTTSYDVVIDNVELTTVASGEEFIMPTSTLENFVCYTDGVNYYQEGATVTVNNDLDLTSISVGSIDMLYGAAMRMTGNGGIRFYTQVEADKIASLRSLGAKVSLGTMIAPLDLLGDKELNFDNATPWESGMSSSSYQCIDVKYNSSVYYENNNTFVGSITNIKVTNIDRQFLGRGYVKVSIGDVTKTFYADYAESDKSNNTRTIRYISTAVRNNGGELYENYKSLVDYYADYGK